MQPITPGRCTLPFKYSALRHPRHVTPATAKRGHAAAITIAWRRLVHMRTTPRRASAAWRRLVRALGGGAVQGCGDRRHRGARCIFPHSNGCGRRAGDAHITPAPPPAQPPPRFRYPLWVHAPSLAPPSAGAGRGQRGVASLSPREVRLLQCRSHLLSALRAAAPEQRPRSPADPHTRDSS
jgi:hypothetical protein